MKSAVENRLFPSRRTLNVRGKLIDLSLPRVMGVINVTPDSFYPGSRSTSDADTVRQAEQMLNAGATFLDVGGYSSRPGAQNIPKEEEKSRVARAVQAIMKNFPDALVSVDTFRAEVAQAAVQEGAALINDISGGELDTGLWPVVAALNVPYVLMHMKGTPQTMNQLAGYGNLQQEIFDYFHTKIARLNELGIHEVIIDPGFGFAKTVAHNFELLNKLEHFSIFPQPLMVGVSRKSMIWRTLNATAEEALNGTTALNTVALLKGCSILRVHDVQQAMECVTLVKALSTQTGNM